MKVDDAIVGKRYRVEFLIPRTISGYEDLNEGIWEVDVVRHSYDIVTFHIYKPGKYRHNLQVSKQFIKKIYPPIKPDCRIN